MMQDIQVNAQSKSEASSPDQSVSSVPNDVTLIGLASLLPQEYQSLCTCAGLFYAQVQGDCASGDLYRVEIAALSHYFNADRKTRQRHVRTIFLAMVYIPLLVEYDRRLASLPTCDLREVAEQHIALHATHIPCQKQTVCQQTIENNSPAAKQQGETSQSLNPYVHHARKANPRQQGRYAEIITIVIPVEAIRAAYDQMEHRRCRPLSRRHLPLVVLRAAVGIAQHTQSEAQLRRVLVMRDKEPVHLEMNPVYARGRQRGMVGISICVEVLQLVA